MKLKLRTASETITTDLSEDSTLDDLKDLISEQMEIGKKRIKILIGFPPKILNADNSKKLIDCSIKSGDTIIIERDNELIAKPVSIGYSTSNESSSGAESASELQEEICLCDEAYMLRISVPSDNSCLFSCVYFVTHNGILNQDKSNALRQIIVDTISKNPETYNDAYLGKNTMEYCDWILNPNSWGGAIELSILSEHFKLEITCVDILSGAVLRFGQGKYLLRGLLIYDGIHYDPLVLECSHLRRTLFPANEESFLKMAIAICEEARSSRQFTDVNNFTLKCGQCELILHGQEEVKEHATATNHSQFGEV